MQELVKSEMTCGEFSYFEKQLPVVANETFCVDARTLHGLLGVKDSFSHWFEDQIRRWQKIENEDFKLGGEKSPASWGGSNAKDYLLTLDCAKDLCMVSRTEQGKKVREYFIAVEKRVTTPKSDREVALQLAHQLIEMEEERKLLIEQNHDYAAFTATDAKSITVEQWAKGCGMSRPRGFEWLRNNGYLTHSNLPIQRYLDIHWFEVKTRYVEFGGGKYTQTFITGLGAIELTKIYNNGK